MSATSVLLERYGAPSPWRRRALLAGVVVVVLGFAGWVAWTAYDAASPRVSSSMETWEVQSPYEVSAVALVRLADPQVDATCRFRAIAADHTTVGEDAFTPDPSQGERQVHTLRTERRAASVEWLGCTAPGQPRPR